MVITLREFRFLWFINILCRHQHLVLFFLHLVWLGYRTVLQVNVVQRKCYRLQRFFTLLRRQLALPHRDAVPAHLCQLFLLLTVAFLVPAYLCHPELSVRLRNLAAHRTLNLFAPLVFWRGAWSEVHIVTMPEATIHKDTCPILPQHQVRMPRQPLVVQPITKSSLPQPSPHNHLRLRVLRPNSRHVIMSLLC